jgi:hypothetical protein
MTSRPRLVPQIHFSAIVITILLLALPTLAQQDQTPAQQSSSSQQQSKQRKTGKNDKNKQQVQQSGTSNDRLFFALPNFLTVENAGQIPPLTTGQKFKVVARSTFDYVEFPWYGALAGISQAENSEPAYGQGATGYAKRYGTAFADGTIENFWTSAILPSALHQDPRYFQLGQGSIWHRTGYAITRIFVTRSDSGHSQFNASEMFGSAIAAGISTYTYHPQSERTLGNTASVWGTEVGYDALTFVLKEFWPDIRRKLAHH